MSLPGGGNDPQSAIFEAQANADEAQSWLTVHRALLAQIRQQLAWAQAGLDGNGNPLPQEPEEEYINGSWQPVRDAAGNPVMGPADQSERIEQLKAQETSLSADIKQAETAYQYWYEQRWDRYEAYKESQGQPLTPEEIAAKQADLENVRARTAETQANTAKAEIERQLKQAELEAKQAEAYGLRDPRYIAAKNKEQQLANDLARAQAEAQRASAVANRAEAVYREHQAEIDRQMLPYKQRESDAATAVNEANAEAVRQDTTRSKAILQSELDQYAANIRNTNASAAQVEAEARNLNEKLDLGLSEIEIREAAANATKAQAEAQKALLGDPQHALQQLQDGLKAGRLNLQTAQKLGEEVVTGKSLADRIADVDRNATNLMQTASQYGMYVRPGQTSFDPTGSLQKLLGKVGIELSPEDFALDTKSTQQWAQQAGINLDPRMGVGQLWDAQGNLMPSGGPEGPPPPMWQQQMAAPPTPADVPVPIPGKTEPEAPVSEWQQGVNASPVLSAAQQYGEAINAEPVAPGVTKITYRDGTTRWFNEDGSEAQEPAAPAPAAPAAPAPAQAATGGGSPNTITINVNGGGASTETPAIKPPPYRGTATAGYGGPGPAPKPPGTATQGYAGPGPAPQAPPPPPPGISGSGLPVQGPPHQGAVQTDAQRNAQMDTRRMAHGGMRIVPPPAWYRQMARQAGYP